MCRPSSVSSRTMSARELGFSSVCCSVANICSTLMGEGGWGQWGSWRKTRGRFFASLKNDRDAGVKCGRRGAVRAATANRGLRFLGFARNDRGALRWNDIGRYGGRASGPVLARDAR